MSFWRWKRKKKRENFSMENKYRILVVDDEENIRNIVQKFLIKYGYHVIVASGGSEAIEKFKQVGGQVDLVIQDMVLPETSGIEVFKKLREINPLIKVILTSGHDKDASEYDNDDAITFLKKPFRIAQLIQKLEEMLDTQ